MEEMSLEQGLEEIGHKILVLTRNELYMKMRFMDVALSAFYYVQDFSVDLLATDGETMYFNGQMLGGEYRQNRIEVNRAYLHLVLHCIFRHLDFFRVIIRKPKFHDLLPSFEKIFFSQESLFLLIYAVISLQAHSDFQLPDPPFPA